MRRRLSILLLLLVPIVCASTTEKPFREKLHDPTTDRPFPLIRDERLDYWVEDLEWVGDFYRLAWDRAYVSFGITERGVTEVIVLGTGRWHVRQAQDVRFQVILQPHTPPEPLEGSVRVPYQGETPVVYIRLHPADTGLRIPATRLHSARDPKRHKRTEEIHRTRFSLYLVHDEGLAVIPPPGVRVIDVEREDRGRIVIFDAPGVQRSVTWFAPEAIPTPGR